MKKQTIEEFCKDFNTTIKEAEDKLRSVVFDDETQYFTTKNDKGQCLQHLYFSIISLGDFKIKNILEIGTGYGESTKVLSELFPDATIKTFDIPEDDPKYNEFALRKDSINEFGHNISQSNVVYYEMNSFFLLDELQDEKFDLIWLDGGHNYPAVAWDMMYSYGAVNKGGIILMHDYNRPNTFVKPLVDEVDVIIPEEIKLIPFAKYDKSSSVAWLRKQ